MPRPVAGPAIHIHDVIEEDEGGMVNVTVQAYASRFMNADPYVRVALTNGPPPAAGAYQDAAFVSGYIYEYKFNSPAYRVRAFAWSNTPWALMFLTSIAALPARRFRQPRAPRAGLSPGRRHPKHESHLVEKQFGRNEPAPHAWTRVSFPLIRQPRFATSRAKQGVRHFHRSTEI